MFYLETINRKESDRKSWHMIENSIKYSAIKLLFLSNLNLL
ncbi:hypothetical protein FDUTEX481_06844 [Tolypothrix sp. PCC 7601]|nr:hypothetical protein FDUTEX481_06844 [Tolypothrix sp. PCC 7601]